MSKMRRAIISLVVLSSFCGLALARCVFDHEADVIYMKCKQNATRKHSLESGTVIRREQYENSNNTEQEITKDTERCYFATIRKISPEIAKTWFECNYLFDKDKQEDEKTKCLDDEFKKACPLKLINGSARWSLSNFKLIAWAILYVILFATEFV